ncbi:MAG: protein kinase, partial [Terriglobales bacterium]
ISGASPVFSAALTRSSPASPLTSVGSIVGTVQYMSPEQIEGRDSDARSDIFAFGLVLYEMIGGRRAFEGKTQASIVASILALEPPPLSSIQPGTPTPLNTIVHTCLAKDPDDRFQTAHDLKLQLQVLTAMDLTGPRTALQAGKAKAWLPWSLAAIFVLLAAGAGLWAWKLASAPVKVVRGTLMPPGGGSFATFNIAQVSPDGNYVVYGASVNGVNQLWLQSMDSETPMPMTGTEAATFPFWSADSRSIGFFSGSRLKRAEVGGGPAQTICDVIDGRGGSWNADGVIIYGARISPIMRVSAAGGQPIPVTEFDKTKNHGTHRWPWFLPDGKHFIYMGGVTGNDSPRNELFLGSLEAKTSEKLIAASSNVVYASGHLLYRREGALMAQPFDIKKRAVAGDAVPIVEQLKFDPGTSVGTFSASTNGLLVYQHGTGSSGAQQLTWFDDTGKKLGTAGDPSTAYGFRLSPDGTKAAVQLVDSTGNVDIWIYDVARSVKSRLTFGPARDAEPVWFPDGKRVAYTSEQGGQGQIFVKSADGSGGEERLLQHPDYTLVDDISTDGKYLTFTTRTGNNTDLWVLPLAGEKKAVLYLQTPFNEISSNISPDSRWLAYSSDESGRFEIYVSTFPQAGGKWQVSSNGGREAMWSPSGKELYFLTLDNELMVASITATATSVQPGVPKKLFASVPVPGRKVYDIARNGRIMVNGFGTDRSTALPLSFTVNWPATVRR